MEFRVLFAITIRHQSCIDATLLGPYHLEIDRFSNEIYRSSYILIYYMVIYLCN